MNTLALVLLSCLACASCRSSSAKPGFVDAQPAQVFEQPALAATLAGPSAAGWKVQEFSEGENWWVNFLHPVVKSPGAKIGETAAVFFNFEHADFEPLRKQVKDERELLQTLLGESPMLNLEGPNFTRRSAQTSFRTISGVECAWYDQLWEERNNPADPAAVLVLHNVGFLGIHPNDKTCGFCVMTSERNVLGAPATIDPVQLAEEAARGLSLSAPHR